MSQAPCRPPRVVDVPVSSMMQAREFEQCYKDAYSNIDRAITLCTENKHEEVGDTYNINPLP